MRNQAKNQSEIRITHYRHLTLQFYKSHAHFSLRFDGGNFECEFFIFYNFFEFFSKTSNRFPYRIFLAK